MDGTYGIARCFPVSHSAELLAGDSALDIPAVSHERRGMWPRAGIVELSSDKALRRD